MWKYWKVNVSYTDLLNSVQFGSNQNFDWICENDSKSPDIKSVETSIRLNRLRYFGHIQRIKENRLAKFIFHAEVNAGQRKPGRPKNQLGNVKFRT